MDWITWALVNQKSYPGLPIGLEQEPKVIDLTEENINATLYFILDYNEADFTGELIFYDENSGVKVIPFPPFRLAQPADQQLHNEILG